MDCKQALLEWVGIAPPDPAVVGSLDFVVAVGVAVVAVAEEQTEVAALVGTEDFFEMAVAETVDFVEMAVAVVVEMAVAVVVEMDVAAVVEMDVAVVVETAGSA